MTDERKVFTAALLAETLAAFSPDMPVLMRLDDLLGEVTEIRAEAQGIILESD